MHDLKPDHAAAPIEARTLRLYAAIASAALVAFGVFCWVAANWAGLHRLTRIELVAGALVLACGAAAAAARIRIPALLIAVALVGALLALIGQTYPSGADAWQLFALWALLALPFALAARHDAIWSLWIVVASAGIGLWRAQEFGGHEPADWAPACAIAIALAVGLSRYLPLQRWIGRSVWAFRLASLGAIALIASSVLDSLFLRSEMLDSALLVALVTLVAGAVALALLQPLELGVLAIAVLAIDGLLVVRIARALVPNRPEIDTMLFLALIATAIVAASVALLRAVLRRGADPSETHEQDDGGFSWPLAALSGFGALIATAPFLVFFGLVFGHFIEDPGGAAIVGGATLAAAILVLRGGKPFGFRQMFGMIAGFVGMALIAYATARGLEKNAGFALCLAAAAIAAAVPGRGARSVFGFVAATALIISIFARVWWWDAATAIALTSLVAALGALALAAPSLGAGAVVLAAKPFFAGWAAACLCALIALAGRPFLAGGGVDLFREIGALVREPWSGPAQYASVALGLAGAALMLARRADLRTPAGFMVAAVAVALTVWAPSLGATIFVLACALLAPARALSIAAALAALWIVSALYYSLAWPLTAKGLGLIGLGAALGAVLLATRGREPHDTTTSAPAPVALALIALGAVATGAAAGTAVGSAEAILRNGRTIYIALRPVDPRSLVQGDYMALAFDTDLLRPPEHLQGEVLAQAEVDARSVAKLTALVAPGAKPDPGQLALRLRRKGSRWYVGSDAYFFAEGHGPDFERARYGVFRVGADGQLLLEALADQDLRRIEARKAP